MLIFFKICYLISNTHMNSGFIGIFYYALKIVLISLSFYYVFEQKLNLLDIVGIGFWIWWTLFITLSKSDFDLDEASWNFVFFILLILIASILLIPKEIAIKYYFCYGDNDVNIIAFKVFCETILYLIIWMIGFYVLWGDFHYTFEEMVFASLWGSLHFFASLLSNFVLVRSVAGPAEALQSTASSMNILMDLLIFGKAISTMQAIGLAFSIMSMIWIIFGNNE